MDDPTEQKLGDPVALRSLAIDVFTKLNGGNDAFGSHITANIDQTIAHFRSCGWTDLEIGVMAGAFNLNACVTLLDPPGIVAVKAMAVLGAFLSSDAVRSVPIPLEDLPPIT